MSVPMSDHGTEYSCTECRAVFIDDFCVGRGVFCPNCGHLHLCTDLPEAAPDQLPDGNGPTPIPNP